MATVPQKSFYAHLHGDSGILGKHQDQVLWFSYETGRIVEVTSSAGLVVLAEAGLADGQAFVDKDRGGPAMVACTRQQVVYPNSADNSIAPKTGYNALISAHVGGGNTMVSHHFVYQLVLCALIWFFIILHLTQPKRPVAAPAMPPAPEPLKPARYRPNEPKPSRA